MNHGWLCPKCGGAHGPDVQSCPQVPLPVPLPVPYYPMGVPCSACGNSGVCMCTRPGRGGITWTISDGYGLPSTT